MKKGFNIIGIIWAITCMVLFCSQPWAFELTLHDNRITLQAHQVKLQTLLQDLAQKADIQVRIDPGLNPYVSADFKNRDLETVLESLLASYNHALKWESAPGPGPPVRIREIHIFKPGDPVMPLGDNRHLDIARNPRDNSFYVKGEILVRLKPGVEVQQLRAILDPMGGTLGLENSDLGIYRIKLPVQADIPALVDQLKPFPGIETAEPNYAYPMDPPHPYRTDSKIPGSDDATPLPEGSPVIAVMDSGLAPGYLPLEQIHATQDALDPGAMISDSLGHGTQMALVAAGRVTPLGVEKNNANPIIAIRAFDENGFTSTLTLIRGIDFALANGARVLSLSWGSSTQSRFMGDALGYGGSKGLIIVASAGNEPTGKPVYPAAYESVIGIGALAPDGQQWENTNHGDFVDAYVPGFADMPVGYRADPGIYAGTSISAAFAANQIAVFLSQHPDADRAKIMETLFSKK